MELLGRSSFFGMIGPSVIPEKSKRKAFLMIGVPLVVSSGRVVRSFRLSSILLSALSGLIKGTDDGVVVVA